MAPSHLYTVYELEHMVRSSGFRAILSQDRSVGCVEQLLAMLRLKAVVTTELVALLPAWKRAVGRLLGRVPLGRSAP